MNYFIYFIQYLLLISLFVIYLTVTGWRWQEGLVLNKSFAFRVSSAFFIGVSAFLFLFGLSELIIDNARYSAVFSILLLSPFVFYRTDFRILLNNQIKIIISYIFLVSITFLTLINSPKPDDNILNNIEAINPLHTVSLVAHSLRAGNLSIYIDEENKLPRVSQNFTQSILASLPSLVGFKSPQLGLSLWHGLLIGFIYLLVYGYFRKKFNRYLSAFAALALMFANTTFSSVYVRTVDVGSTLILIRSVDVLFGLGALFITVIILENIYSHKNILYIDDKSNNLLKKRPFYAVISIFFVFGFSLHGVGSQYVLIIIAILFLALIYFFYHQSRNRFAIGILLFIFLFGAGVGVFQGGTLLPAKYGEKEKIHGMLKLENDSGRPFAWRTPWVLADTPGLENEDNNYIKLERSPPKLFKATDDTVDKLYKSAKHFILTLNYLTIPILGIIFYGLTFRYSKDIFCREYSLTYITSVCLLVFGIFIASFFYMYWRVWELTRFLYPGIFFGILLFVTATFSPPKAFLNSKFALLVKVFILIMVIMGPVKHYSGIIKDGGINDVVSGQYFDSNRIKVLIEINEMAKGE